MSTWSSRVARRSGGVPVAEADPRGVGLVFVDVLFAAVATKILEQSSRGGVPFKGKTQLGLAAVLTITAWIAYHNSTNRAAYKMAYINLPLVQFLMDLLLVYLYWLVASSAEQDATTRPTVVPEALMLAVVFLIFLGWDQVALAMRRSSRYPGVTLTDDRPRRRVVTIGFFGVFAVFAVLSTVADPRDRYLIGALDLALAVGLIAHRYIQHLVTGRQPPAADSTSTVDR
jgi:hypothetical protein